MAWETKWPEVDNGTAPNIEPIIVGKPVAPEWAKPQLDKITEEAKQASEWVGSLPYEIKSTPGVDTAWLENELIIKLIKLGNKTISVIVVGDLGLDFCEPEEKDEGWNIYHLPTLACFSSAVPSYLIGVQGKSCEYDKQPLLNWMARVQENYPTSWQVLRLLTPDTYQDNGATAKEIIQKWCLSVKVE